MASPTLSPSSLDLQEQQNYCEIRRKLSSINSTKSSNGRISIVSKLVPKPSILFSTGSSSMYSSTISATEHQANLTAHVVKTIRWITAWDLWLYALKSEMKAYVTEFSIRNSSHLLSAKASLIQALESMASRSLSQKDVKIIFYLIDIWEEVRREGVAVLSALQITSCEHKSELKRIRLDQLLKIELGQETIIARILHITRTIDNLYAELEDLVDKQIDTKCLPIGLDNSVASALAKLRARDETAFALPDEIVQKYLNSNNFKKAQPNYGRVSPSSPFYNLPDFFEPLFVGRQIPVNQTVVTCAARFDRIIEIAMEWFMAWCLFGESIFDELSSLIPKPRTFSGQQGLLEKQIKQIHNIYTEVVDIAYQESVSWNVQMKSCLFVLESLTTLLEVTKHESSYLIHHLENIMLVLGATELKKMPENPAAARVYCIRNVVLSKDRTLTASTEYLYQEISNLIDLIETKFHNYPDYFNEFGPLTARLMSKFTQDRKDLFQNIAPESLQLNDLNLEQLDEESTTRTLDGFVMDEESLTLSPETLKPSTSIRTRADSPTSGPVHSSVHSVDQTASSFEISEYVSVPLASPANSLVHLTPNENSTAGSADSNENDYPPNVFDVDPGSGQSGSASDQDQPGSAVKVSSKSGVWKNLVKKLSFHKSARK